MKNYMFLIFFGVVLTLYTLLNLYIHSRGAQAFAAGSTSRVVFSWLFWILAVSYPLARITERFWLSPVSDALTWVGSFWLAIFFYLLLATLLIDVLRLINWVVPFFHLLSPDQSWLKIMTFTVTVGLVLTLVAAGHINALTTQVAHHSVHIRKKGPLTGVTRVVAVSDVHLGTLIGPRRLSNLAELVAAQKPDMILFAGDVVDEDLAPVIRHDLGALLQKFKAPMGVFAITGNHEYIGGAERAVKYLADHGLVVLRDTAVLVDDALWVVGREDRDRDRFSGKSRKSLGELAAMIDLSKPAILLDHQPFKLDEVARSGFDIQISGHTHHGQLWPLNFITSAIFELSKGYLPKGDSHFFVSTGFGTWGPPVRTGNRPEIMVIDITFDR